MNTLIEMGVPRIVLVMQIPEATQNVLKYVEKANKFGWNMTAVQIQRTQHGNLMRGVNQSLKNIAKTCSACSIVDPADILCDNKICQTTFKLNGTDYPLYIDDNHLNDFGIRKILNIYRLHR